MLINIVCDDLKSEELLQTIISGFIKPYRLTYNNTSYMCDVAVVLTSRFREKASDDQPDAHFVIFDDRNPLLMIAYKGKPNTCSVHEWLGAKHVEHKSRCDLQMAANLENLSQQWQREMSCKAQSGVLEKLNRRLQATVPAAMQNKTMIRSDGSLHLEQINEFFRVQSPRYTFANKVSVPIFMLHQKERYDRLHFTTQTLHPFLIHPKQMECIPTSSSTRNEATTFMLDEKALSPQQVAKWMLCIDLWRRIAAGIPVAFVCGDDMCLGTTFGRDFSACSEWMHQVDTSKEPVCLWLSYHIPLQYRGIFMMNTEPRTVSALSETKEEERYLVESYIVNQAFAKLLLNHYQRSPSASIHDPVDRWMIQQQTHRHIRLDVPIVYNNQYFDNGNTSSAIAKLSPFNKLLCVSSMSR